MTDKAPFGSTDLDSYKLTGVTVTDRKLGHGSYATVLELEYMGLKCAGKKIHEALLYQGRTSYTFHRFEEECRLLSQLRHPKIIQFLGLYIQNKEQLPILVMEFLPTTLASCIEEYGILPKEISYSILYDVALGLCYLHSQNPPIIHRDLSSNNILLTSNMMAKISDLGVARILDISPVQISHMTQIPGTPAFMPPEVMVANPQYDISVDQFSYGIMMIHIFCGKWPDPQIGPTCSEHGKLIPVSEARRRKVYLEVIGSGHPLMDLILKCIENDPERRMPANMITNRLAKMVSKFPFSFQNQIQMQKYIKASEEEKRALREIGSMRAEMIRHKEEQFVKLKENTSKQLEMERTKTDRLNMTHTLELKELQANIEHLKANLRTTELEKIAALKENETLEINLSKQLEKQERYDKTTSTTFENALQEVKAEFEASLSEERVRMKQLLFMEKERGEREREKLQTSLEEELDANTQLCIRTAQLNTENETLKTINSRLELQAAMKDTKIERYVEEIKAKEFSLQQKDAHSSTLSEQLTMVRKFLANKKQPMQVSIAWEKRTELPFATAAGQSTVINGKIYFGGGVTDDDKKRYLIYCYHPTEDQWTTLPSVPVKYFGLGQISGRLTVIGGAKKDGRKQNELYTFDLHKYKCTIPPMALARTFPAVTTLNNEALLVAGGNTGLGRSISEVEIYRNDTSQWQMATSLPTPCCNLSLVPSGDTLYALGGFDQPSKLNQVLHISIGDLLQDNHKKASWTALQPTPSYQPAAAMFAGKLIAIGGWKEAEGDTTLKSIQMYSSSTNSWLYFADLPDSCAWSACSTQSSTEILVIGGRNKEKVKTVYKGTLTLGV